MTDEPGLGLAPTPTTATERSWRSSFSQAELDTRLIGMVIALALIWILFHIVSHGDFITARNLWNLSVQSTSIAVMATGMVLIIVSRNIDLSVGSLMGFLGYFMAMTQWRWIPDTFGLGLNHWWIWIVALAAGILLGALIGGVQGFVVAYVGVPAFIVTLGGFLVWRGLIFRLGAKGQTIAPLDKTFLLLGGGARGNLGEWKSWLLGVLACVAIVATLVVARRQRQRHDLPVRDLRIEVAIAVVGCGAVLAIIGLIANKYISPITGDPTGIAYPVVILIGVTLLMTYLTKRRRFGRYVFAYGGNPEAAELGGINTKRTVMYTYVVMGMLCAVSGAISSARLESAVTGLGVQNELDVISAAVIGGTSFAGGVGTIPGAVLGAVIMQSLRSGMVLLKIDSPSQDIVVGVVLVTAVAIDAALRLRRRNVVISSLAAGIAIAALIIQTGRQ